MTDLYFEVIDGDALDLVHRYVLDYKRCRAQAVELAKEFGAERYWLGNDGVFALDIAHPEFTKRDRKGRARPKRGTAAAARFAQQTPTAFKFGNVAHELGIPHGIAYGNSDGAQGWRRTASHRFHTAGVLFITEDGPYAIYCPDIREAVASLEAEGYTVDPAAKAWQPIIPGCRLIHEAQWKLYVARHEYDEAMKGDA